MSRDQKSPQEKKALSLRKDRRNTYGNSDKAARTCIPLWKALEIRRNRHKNNQAIAAIEKLAELRADLVESSARHDVYRVRGWVKGPHEPLGDVIASKLEQRERRVGAKLRRQQSLAASSDRSR
jgi:hypothetical protein